MCTVVWTETKQGYELFFNRDEKRTRPSALPPARAQINGVKFIAPRDPKGGGTWLGINEYGVTACILNYYHGEEPPPIANPVSRGLLLNGLLGAQTSEYVTATLSAQTLETYRPFIVLALDTLHAPQAVAWNGTNLQDMSSRLAPPLSTSSFETSTVIDNRMAVYGRMIRGVPSTEALLAYHRSHEPEKGPYSVCMHRPDACTVSFTHVKVTMHIARMAYYDTPPCCMDKAHIAVLERHPQEDA